MTDKKYTDEEIIKALEYCNADRNECDKCILQKECESNPFYSAIAKHALDFINRQKVFIESQNQLISELALISKNAKVEAYKEFADLAIQDICEKVTAPTPSESYIAERCIEQIDNLLKEMVGEEE